jgi:hypothetical protein
MLLWDVYPDVRLQLSPVLVLQPCLPQRLLGRQAGVVVVNMLELDLLHDDMATGWYKYVAPIVVISVPHHEQQQAFEGPFLLDIAAAARP